MLFHTLDVLGKFLNFLLCTSGKTIVFQELIHFGGIIMQKRTGRTAPMDVHPTPV